MEEYNLIFENIYKKCIKLIRLIHEKIYKLKKYIKLYKQITLINNKKTIHNINLHNYIKEYKILVDLNNTFILHVFEYVIQNKLDNISYTHNLNNLKLLRVKNINIENYINSMTNIYNILNNINLFTIYDNIIEINMQLLPHGYVII